MGRRAGALRQQRAGLPARRLCAYTQNANKSAPEQRRIQVHLLHQKVPFHGIGLHAWVGLQSRQRGVGGTNPPPAPGPGARPRPPPPPHTHTHAHDGAEAAGLHGGGAKLRHLVAVHHPPHRLGDQLVIVARVVKVEALLVDKPARRGSGVVGGWRGGCGAEGVEGWGAEGAGGAGAGEACHPRTSPPARQSSCRRCRGALAGSAQHRFSAQCPCPASGRRRRARRRKLPSLRRSAQTPSLRLTLGHCRGPRRHTQCCSRTAGVWGGGWGEGGGG